MNKKKTVLIIGAGHGGKAFIELFSSSTIFLLIGVVDSNTDALGIPSAHRQNIPVYTTIESVPEKEAINLVLNLTGNSMLDATLYEVFCTKDQPDCEILSPGTSQFLWDLLREAVQREQKIVESEQKYKTLMSNVPGIVYQCRFDESWTMLFMSHAAQDITGYHEDEFINNNVRTYASIIHADDRQMVYTMISKVLKERKSFLIEYRIVDNTGTVRWIHERGRGIYNEAGDVLWIDGVIFDYTEKRQVEQQLRESSQEWKRTFDSIPDLMFIQDKESRILRVNKALCERLKKKPEEIIGKRCFEVMHGSNIPWPNCPFQETLKDKHAHIEEVCDEKIGTPLLISVSPIFNDMGEIIGAVHIAKDITNMKRTEQELKRKMKDLETFQKVAVDRELKMAELKKRIQEFERKESKL